MPTHLTLPYSTAFRNATRCVALLFLAIAAPAVHAGYPWTWSYDLVSTDPEEFSDVAIDQADGSVYVVGDAENTGLTIGPLTVFDQDQGILIKFDQLGNMLWYVPIGGSDQETTENVTIAPNGNIYITGGFKSSGKFYNAGSSTSAATLVSFSGSIDIYVACYSPAGVLQWVKQVGNGNDEIYPYVAADANGVTLLAGYKGSLTYAGSSSAGALNSGTNDMLLMRFDGAGNFQWLRTGGSSNDDLPASLATDGNQVYVGSLIGNTTLRWYNSSNTQIGFSTAASTRDHHISAITTSGAYAWSSHIDDPTNTIVGYPNLAVGCEGVIVSGAVSPGSTFPNGTAAAGGAGDEYFYVERLDATTGAFVWGQWGTTATNSDHFNARDVAIGKYGQVHICGTFTGTVAYGGQTMTSLSGDDVFLMTLREDGTLRQLEPILTNSTQYAAGVAADDMGGVAMVGFYYSGINIPLHPLAASGGQNGFVAYTQMGAREPDFRDPSRFQAPSSVCKTGGTIDLSTWMIPTTSGNAVAVMTSANVSNPGSSLAAPNSSSATLTGGTGSLTVDLGTQIPAGEAVLLRWRKNTLASATPILSLQASGDNSTWTVVTPTLSTARTTYIYSSALLPVATRYVRVQATTTGGSVDIDAFVYAFGTQAGGTWTGPGVSGTQFNPAAQSGTVTIVYTYGTGACGDATSKSVIIDPPPVAGTISGGGTFCPGSNVTLTLAGYAGDAIKWSTSPNGSTWTAIQSGVSNTFTLSNISGTQYVKASVSRGNCAIVDSPPITVIAGDNTPPVALCQTATIQLYNGTAILLPAHVDGGSTDNCGIANMTVSPNTFASAGTYPVVLTVTDAAGLSATCTTSITVIQPICPTTYYLDGIGDQSDVPTGFLKTTPPTDPSLDNFDSLRNSDPGLFVHRGGSAFTETDVDRHQLWLIAPVPNILNAPVSFKIWSAMKDFDTGDGGRFTAYLLETNAAGNARVLLATATVNRADWDVANTGTWIAESVDFGTITHTIPAAKRLAVMIIVPNASDDDMWFAYDATQYPSRLVIGIDQLPQIVCPGNISTSSDPGVCGTVINYGVPVGTDDCPGATTTLSAGQVSGSLFPKGSSTVTYKVTDVGGNTATCSFTATVLDNEDPSIVCPSNILVNNDPGVCGAIVNYTPPVGTDNCAGAITTRIGGPATGALFPVASTTVSYRVTDATGSLDICSFVVTVVDNQPPTVICPNNEILVLSGNQCSALYSVPAIAYSDNCASAVPIWSATVLIPAIGTAEVAVDGVFTTDDVIPLDAGSIVSLAPGVHGFSDTISDGTNEVVCSWTVTVEDNSVPIVICPDTVLVPGDANCTYLFPDLTAGIIVVENCPVDTAQSYTAGVDTLYTSGYWQVDVIDIGGNIGSCSSFVQLIDTLPPAFTNCPGSDTLALPGDDCTVEYFFPTLHSEDACDSDTDSDYQTLLMRAGGTSADTVTGLPSVHLAIGLNSFWEVHTDDAGNATTCSWEVTVQDLSAPYVYCPLYDSLPLFLDGNCELYFPDLRDSLTVSDCNGRTNTMVPTANTLFTQDTLVSMTMWIEDSLGNGRWNNHTIWIHDNTPPSITCLNDTVVQADPTTCLGSISPAPLFFGDNCNTSTWVSSLAAGAYPSDLYPITLTASDGNSNATCSYSVSVRDTLILCSGDRTFTAATAGDCTANVVLPPQNSTTVDLCGPWTWGGSSHSSGAWAVNDTVPVSYTIIDAAGLPHSCTFSITVLGAALPDFTYADLDLCSSDGTTAPLNNMPVSGLVYSCNTCATAINNDGSFDAGTIGIGTHMIICTAPCFAPMGDTVVVVVSEPVNAGVDNTITVCTSGAAFAMIDSLSGTPQAGGSWTGPGGTLFGGTLDPSTAAPGDYEYTVSGTGGCGDAQATVNVIINGPVDPEFSYAAPAFCTNGTDPAPDLNGGVFSALPSGLVINASTGIIDLSASTPGTYNITQAFTNGACASAWTVQAEIVAAPNVSTGTYGPLCSNGAAIALTGTPAGGTWSGTGVSGNSFNPASGTQTITYTMTSGGCTNSASTTVTVNPAPVVSTGTYGPLCSNGAAIALTGTPAGGTWSGTGVSGN
ncbi:MAG: HYR domain-containing protein, partial [Flavobacteriales bacterium]